MIGSVSEILLVFVFAPIAVFLAFSPESEPSWAGGALATAASSEDPSASAADFHIPRLLLEYKP